MGAYMVPYQFKMVVEEFDADPDMYHVLVYVARQRLDHEPARWRLLFAYVLTPSHKLLDEKQTWRELVKRLAKNPF